MKLPLNAENLSRVVIIGFGTPDGSIALATGFNPEDEIDLGGDMDNRKELYLLDIGARSHPLIVTLMEAITHKSFVCVRAADKLPYPLYLREDAPEPPRMVLKLS